MAVVAIIQIRIDDKPTEHFIYTMRAHTNEGIQKHESRIRSVV